MSSICKSFESNAWRNDLCSHCFQSKEEHDLLLLQPMTSSNPAKDVASSVLPSSSSSSSSNSGLGSRYQSVLNHCRSSYRTGSTTTSSSTTTTNNSLTSSSVVLTAAASSTAATTTTSAPVMNPSTRLSSSSSGVKAILKTSGNSNNQDNKSGTSSSNNTTRTKHSKSVNFPDGDQDAHEEVIGYGGQECFEDDTDEDETDHRSSNDDDDDIPFTDEERMVQNLIHLTLFFCVSLVVELLLWFFVDFLMTIVSFAS